MLKYTFLAAALMLAAGLLFMPGSSPAQAYDPTSYIGRYDPPADFCSVVSCVSDFFSGNGYVVRCNDGVYSKSGGIQGACSQHGGVSNVTAAATATVTPTRTATTTVVATSTVTPIATATLVSSATAIPTSTRPATPAAPVATPFVAPVAPAAAPSVQPPRTGDGGLR